MPAKKAANVTVDPVEIIDRDGLKVVPLPTSKRRLRLPLKTLANVRDEMARVYRRMKVGDMKIEDGKGLVYALACLSKTIADSILEEEVIQAIQEAKQTRISNGTTRQIS